MPSVLRASPLIFPNQLLLRKSSDSNAASRLSGGMERQSNKLSTPFMRVVADLSKTQFNANWVLLSLLLG
jgi:hypothetical protein